MTQHHITVNGEYRWVFIAVIALAVFLLRDRPRPENKSAERVR
jgi:hypothetical protein